MRRLLALLGAQCLGITAADAGWLPAPVAARLALLAAGLALLARSPRRRLAAACVALAAAGGFGLASRLEAAATAPAAPLEATIEGTVAARRALPGGLQLELEQVRGVAPPDARAPSRLLLRGSGAEAVLLGDVVPGARLRARVRIRPLEGRANPGGPDREREAARRGIGAVAALAHPDLVVRRPDAERWRPLAPLYRLRARAARRLAREGEGGALVAALGVGERAGLAGPGREAFRRLGLSHLLSVSGLHLALAGAGAFRLFAFLLARSGSRRARSDPRPLALAAACAAATGYALLAGFEVPVRRSLALLLGLGLSIGARRPTPRGAPLVAAALLVLAFEPGALFDLGARLSFAASAALVWALRTPGEASIAPTRLARARRGLAGALSATAAAGAATAPIAANTLGVAAPGWALAANAVAIPWTGVLLVPASLLASLAAGLAPDAAATGWLCRAAAALAALTMATLERVATHAPLATAAPVAGPALAAAAALAAVALRARTPWLRLAAALATGVLLRLAPPPAIAPAPPRVVVLDVGQGDAVLVQGRAGALLVDGGLALPDGGVDLGATVVVPALRALGVERLDLLAASHGDLDHRGGLPAVLRALPVARVWLPYGGLDDPAFAELLAEARAAGAAVTEQGAGSALLRIGDLRVEALWPPREGPALSRNDRSLALRVEAAGRAVLLPGDLGARAERHLLAAGARLHADVLKLGHHGSRTASSAPWLAAVGGVSAVVSAPRAGRFGMPHAEVAARAREAGYTLWWTGRDGAVLIGLGPELRARGWRRPARRDGNRGPVVDPAPPAASRGAGRGGAGRTGRRRASVEAQHPSREEHDRADHDRPDQPLAAAHRKACAEPATGHEADREDEGGPPGDLAGRDEDRDREGGERHVDRHLDAVGTHQVVAGVAERTHHEQADTGLDRAAVGADPGEGEEREPARPGARGAGRVAPGTAQHRDQVEEHHDTEEALEDGVVDASDRERAEQGAQADRHHDPRGALEARYAVRPEAPGSGQVLEEDADPVGAVRDRSRQPDQHQQRDAQERAAAGQRVQHSSDRAAADQDRRLAERHAASAGGGAA
ncbi:MAG: DNA internalization-related competence protein ComEC/Rec2 [Deltaproteobacteria bacterium]|nr:DNA internalization-related competence protein ComEC/Rec2 [Deltaproteobacteria bacterium]